MTAHVGVIPSAQADKLYSYPVLNNDSDTFLNGNGSFDHPHTEYGARTGVPTSNITAAWGNAWLTNQIVTDKFGHVTAIYQRKITQNKSVATQSAVGLMSAADKTKLDAYPVLPSAASLVEITLADGSAASVVAVSNS